MEAAMEGSTWNEIKAMAQNIVRWFQPYGQS